MEEVGGGPRCCHIPSAQEIRRGNVPGQGKAPPKVACLAQPASSLLAGSCRRTLLPRTAPDGTLPPPPIPPPSRTGSRRVPVLRTGSERGPSSRTGSARRLPLHMGSEHGPSSRTGFSLGSTLTLSARRLFSMVHGFSRTRPSSCLSSRGTQPSTPHTTHRQSGSLSCSEAGLGHGAGRWRY